MYNGDLWRERERERQRDRQRERDREIRTSSQRSASSSPETKKTCKPPAHAYGWGWGWAAAPIKWEVTLLHLLNWRTPQQVWITSPNPWSSVETPLQLPQTHAGLKCPQATTLVPSGLKAGVKL